MNLMMFVLTLLSTPEGDWHITKKLDRMEDRLTWTAYLKADEGDGVIMVSCDGTNLEAYYLVPKATNEYRVRFGKDKPLKKEGEATVVHIPVGEGFTLKRMTALTIKNPRAFLKQAFAGKSHVIEVSGEQYYWANIRPKALRALDGSCKL